jgi:hypothetical protein
MILYGVYHLPIEGYHIGYDSISISYTEQHISSKLKLYCVQYIIIQQIGSQSCTVLIYAKLGSGGVYHFPICGNHIRTVTACQ